MDLTLKIIIISIIVMIVAFIAYLIMGEKQLKHKSLGVPSIFPKKERLKIPKKWEAFVIIIIIAVVFAIFFLPILLPISYSDSKSDKNSPKIKEEIVKNSAWDGSVRQVDTWIRSNLKDPDSLEYIDWSPVVKKEGGGYLVRVKYRAKNSFGGYVIEEKVVILDSRGNVISFYDK